MVQGFPTGPKPYDEVLTFLRRVRQSALQYCVSDQQASTAGLCVRGMTVTTC